MKSNVVHGRFFIECECRSPDHLLIIESYDFETEKGIKESYVVDFFFTGNWKASWYKRIWYALEFILYRKKFCWGDSVGISEVNIEQLEKVINYFKQKKKNKRKSEVDILRNKLDEIGWDSTPIDVSNEYIVDTAIHLANEVQELKKIAKRKTINNAKLLKNTGVSITPTK